MNVVMIAIGVIVAVVLWSLSAYYDALWDAEMRSDRATRIRCLALRFAGALVVVMTMLFVR